MIIDSMELLTRKSGPMYAVCDVRMSLDEFNALPSVLSAQPQEGANMLVDWEGQDFMLLGARTQGTPLVNAATGRVCVCLNVNEVQTDEGDIEDAGSSCPDCGEPQVKTRSGLVCKNGHGF